MNGDSYSSRGMSEAEPVLLRLNLANVAFP